jgi:hypothetical protein
MENYILHPLPKSLKVYGEVKGEMFVISKLERVS